MRLLFSFSSRVGWEPRSEVGSPSSIESQVVFEPTILRFLCNTINPVILNVEKWSNKLKKSCVVNTTRFLKYFRPFFKIYRWKGLPVAELFPEKISFYFLQFSIFAIAIFLKFRGMRYQRFPNYISPDCFKNFCRKQYWVKTFYDIFIFSKFKMKSSQRKELSF